MNVKLDTESIRHAAGLSIPSQICPVRAPFAWFFRLLRCSMGNDVHPYGKFLLKQLFLDNIGNYRAEKLLFIVRLAGVQGGW